MDGNKDEALRCIKLAEEAISSGNKGRALKFIKIAQRLNSSLSVEELFTACEKLDSGSSASTVEETCADADKIKSGLGKCGDSISEERDYTEEHAQLVREIKRKTDYYKILGLEKTCSVEEIRRAYRKLSLKVHPDKNKAPGSEEAFKKVCKAFKFFLLAYLPFSEPDYSLHKNYSYQFPMTTEKHEIQFYVKSSSFDDKFPPGSPARSNIEDNVIKDYKNLLWRYCQIELQKRRWNKNMPIPHCNKLQDLGFVGR
ncbi:chaperone protein dnaJ 49 [Carica papaya]|uniref:chaperone protein dnaJ 49 n=1 Tax=Carica papaya TaxID=3649 RepID=UPI000B8D070B|nr:chaperone protein dnaJ 49 [Carica papaya]